MDAGQELTHTVTTTVNSEGQQIVNEIKLTDGETVVLETKNLVNLKNGKTYTLDAKGEIDGRLIRRVLNVANNLIGTNAFDFKNIDGDATDGALAAFTAQYDADAMNFTGTAPVGSVVRILLEDGSDITVAPTVDGQWSQAISAEQLQPGMNNIFVINGSESNQLIEFDIEAVDNTPLIDDFTFVFAADGKAVTGTAKDKRASVFVSSNGNTYSAKISDDGSYSVNVPAGLEHGAEVRIWLEYGEIEGNLKLNVFYKRSAVLDQNSGQYIAGTALPFESVTVSTDRYGEVVATADSEGIWKADFSQGLKTNSYVVTIIGGTAPTAMQYQGPADLVFELTGSFVSPAQLTGTALPQETVYIQILGTTKEVRATEKGIWSLMLDYAVSNGESALVSSAGNQIEVIYKKVQLQVVSVSANQISGVGQYGSTVTVQAAGLAATTAAVDPDGTWSAYFNPALTNPSDIDVSDAFDTVQAAYVKFMAKAVNSVQLEGIARSGSTVSAGDVAVDANASHRWKLILTEALQVGESIQVINNGVMKNATYKPEFTAYISNDGLSILGTSPEIEVTIAGAVDAVVSVINGEYVHALTEALAVGAVVTIQSGTAVKTVTYTGITSFTAELNPEKKAVLGSVDAPAKIRAVFTDNSMIEIDVPAGSYTLELGRTLVTGVDVLVVACIANNALYQAITLDA